MNGILKSFYKLRTNYYFVDINIFASSESSDHKKEYMFNFNSGNYWYGNSIGFCFNAGKARLTHYEIEAGSGSCKPTKWAFAGSNDKTNWKYNETTEYQMSASEVHPVFWNHGPFKCFQLTGIASQCGSIYHDIHKFEVFGTYYPKDIANIQCSCMKNSATPSMIRLLTFIIVAS